MQFLITVSEVGRSRFAYGAFNPPVDVVLDHGTEFDCPLNDGGGDGYFWGGHFSAGSTGRLDS